MLSFDLDLNNRGQGISLHRNDQHYPELQSIKVKTLFLLNSLLVNWDREHDPIELIP